MSAASEQGILNEQMNAAILAANAAEAQNRPSFLFRPKLKRDGNTWCALYGDNIQEGVAGFGSSPEKAMADFDKNWKMDI